MRLTRLALLILGIFLIVGIAEGTLKLIIPILALMIPIIAIVAYSPIGKSIAGSLNGNPVTNSSEVSANEFNQLKDKYEKLESRFNEYEDEMNKMREALIFSDNDILSRKKISSSPVNSEEQKINNNKQINLEKTL